MTKLAVKIQNYSNIYFRIKNDGSFANEIKMPGNAYFIDNNEILVIPRNDGDCRYPYGTGGFNFWAYASGYMHCNEGLFSPFLRTGEGQEPKIAFFANVPDASGSMETVSLLSVPVMNVNMDVDRFTVFSGCSAYYITDMKDLRFAVRVFVDDKRKTVFTLTAENKTDKPVSIALSSYFNPFLMHDIVENGENRWFREVRYCKDDENGRLGCFIIKTNEDLNRTTSISNYGLIRRSIYCGGNSHILGHEETASRYQYVGGSRGSLHLPQAVMEGTFGNAKHVCEFTEVGAAGDINKLQLGGGDTARYDMTFDYMKYCIGDEEVQKLATYAIDADVIDSLLDGMENVEGKRNAMLKCNVGKSKIPNLKEKVFNPFFEHLKKQVEFCSLIKGYVQLSTGSLIGIRDVFQALEGLVAWQPKAAREKMLEALDFTFPDGRCPRQYSLPVRESAAPAMDLRAFIDQGVWVISTIVTYLKYTGDFAFLDVECGYHEIVDEKAKLVKKSDIRDSVLGHMLRIMNYLTKNRDFDKSNCVCALYGDWNDALDGLGVSSEPGREFGSGVSVMVTLQVYQNLNEMIELLEKIDRTMYSALICKYSRTSDEIREGLMRHAVLEKENKKRIVHGWGDRMAYYVGSFDDTDHKSRHGLTSNAFWVLSKLYDEDMGLKDTILDAFKALDSKYGLKTFDPSFAPDVKGVGRIPKLPAGTAENGAVYIHASVFGIMALFRMGQPEAAWEQLIKALPFTHDYVSCSPYIMPNSYGFNEEKNIDGQSMQDWQTGSSNVLFKLLLKYVFGISPEYDGLWIQPALYIPFESFDFKIMIKSCEISVSYKCIGNAARRFTVNGGVREGSFDDIIQMTRLWIADEELKDDIISISIVD